MQIIVNPIREKLSKEKCITVEMLDPEATQNMSEMCRENC